MKKYFIAVKLMICVLVCYCSIGASAANSLTIDPDSYAPGTNLSAISPFVTLTTSEGAPVYSVPVYSTPGYPIYDFGDVVAQVTTTGLLGSNVFSAAGDINSEWMGFPLDPPYTRGALVITFTQPVTYMSILSAEIGVDAAEFVDDPLGVYIFDSSGALIYEQTQGSGQGPIAYNLIINAYNGFIDYGDGRPVPAFPIYLHEFSGTDIWRVVIAGDSEPTTLDRLTFRSETAPVPEPSTIVLLFAGLAGIGLTSSKRSLLIAAIIRTLTFTEPVEPSLSKV
jgi:hypothetical protein